MKGRLSALGRRVFARIPGPLQSVVRRLVEGTFNAGPDSLFLAVQRRYVSALRTDGSAEPPALLRFAAFRRRVPSSVERFEIPGRPDLSMVNVESIGTQVVFWTGHRWVAQHGAGLALWEGLCSRADNIAELGANVGFYAIAGAGAAAGDYSAFEPHPHSCATLRQNLSLNGLDRVGVVEAAVVPGAAPATVELICPTGTDHAAPSGAMVRGSSFEKDVAVDGSAIVVVKAVSIDDAIADRDLVKIDVEGLEAPLLSSAREQLKLSKPAIMVEIHDFNADLRALVPELIADLDATVYAMHDDHLVPVTRDVLERGQLMQTCRTWDFLIVPAKRESMVAGLVRA